MNLIEQLRDQEKDNIVHIIGYGPSLDSYFPDESDISICIDESFRKFPCKYIITKYHYLLNDMLRTGKTVITSKLDFSKRGFHKKLVIIGNQPSLFIFDERVNYQITIIDALLLATILNARSIVIHGFDYPFRSGSYKDYPGRLETDDNLKNDYPRLLRLVLELKNVRFAGITKEMILPYAQRMFKNETWFHKSLLQVL